ncbi:DUF6228 family protein [Micromonospora krabiensis]|uniref:Uncharacterized protein n=1 Tax=Micromonospora krabiensis TaxID=307121 RepID=A0A1C3MW91_9ACTN|nr:DUF6228 family protein [Micromonospora krabiensis]SBV24597.1 hypothetical protein GA0070620_0018 [Micromonospora krabiensis]
MRHAPADPDELVIRCVENPDATVRLYDRYFPDEYGTGFSVELQADGMRARFSPVEVWVWDDVDLPDFVAGLADDFRGWTGKRSWSSNHLTVDASYHSRGWVDLRWTLQPWLTRADGWSASVTTWVEAGAQMSRLAGDLRRFLPDVRARQGE